MKNKLLHTFKQPITGIPIPEKFTYPFHYEPHPLARLAAAQLQEHIQEQGWFLEGGPQATLGKMFGVLVVQDRDNNLGFLAAFSGKLANSNHHEGFVPPLYDMLDPQGFFMTESKRLEQLNEQITQLENDKQYLSTQAAALRLKKENDAKLHAQQIKIKHDRAARKTLRAAQQQVLMPAAYNDLCEKHNQQRINERFLLREYEVYLNDKHASLQALVTAHEQHIIHLKVLRKETSNTVQDRLFEQYTFLNALGDTRNVVSIFNDYAGIVPPAGAGDCAAPKLLQYAYLNDLKPIAMAEFWWGKPAPSQIRKQGVFYPACRSKCEPILGHMLQGLQVEDNPLLVNPAIDKELEIIYEDAYLLVINKPAEFLSVPGKTITDSVQERMRKKYPHATGPLVVHRLDMSTSGLMVIALTKEVHEQLQEQFMQRTVLKRYEALLDGAVAPLQGFIDLPLRVDLDNRPYQMVCYEHGKAARTRYEVIAQTHGQTRIHFYPITGRTHQLRMHAAHPSGLNAPIVGDDLYGTRKDRLHLHAALLTFKHPITHDQMTVTSVVPF